MARARRRDMAFYEAIGNRIQKARHGKMTQESLASAIALTRTSIVNIERGRQQLLVHTLVDIARALQVPIADLIPPPPGPSAADLATALRGQPKKAKDWITGTVKAALKET